MLRGLEDLDSGERLWRLEVNTHEHDQDAGELGLNAIGRVALRASGPDGCARPRSPGHDEQPVPVSYPSYPS